MMSYIAIITAYLLGSIPSAYYAGKWVKGIDLRTVGSGNLGFTNALRILGLKWSIPVLLFDILKGSAAVCIACYWISMPDGSFFPSSNIFSDPYKLHIPTFQFTMVMCGLAAILGHNWTLFLGFKGGGKGVATSAGVFLALTPIPFLITFIVFLSVLFTTKYMSLASLTGAVVLVITTWGFYWYQSTLSQNFVIAGFVFIAALLVIIRHISNIKRLIAGTENKFSLSKKKENLYGNHSSH